MSNTLGTGRATGIGLSPRMRLKFMLQIRTIWAEDPTITVAEMVRRTRASGALVQRIRKNLIDEGKLKKGNRT